MNVCDRYDNSRYCYDALKASGVKGFDKRMELDLKCTMCEVLTDISLADKEYGYINCITRQCNDCSPQLLVSEILKENPGLMEDPTVIKWKRWDSDELTKCTDPHIETGSKYQWLKVLGDDMKGLALHLFDMQWNYSQFRYINDPETLEYGHLVQVMDFGKNHLNQPQSLFWYQTQTVIHPIINYYRCLQCPKKIVTDGHIIISDK